MRRILHNSNSRLLGALTRNGLVAIERVTAQPPNGFLRSLASVSQPIDPLVGSRSLPEISVVIPFVEKDLPTLEMAVIAASQTIRNPVSEIVIATPRAPEGEGPAFEKAESFALLAGVIDRHPEVSLAFDEDIVGETFLSLLQENGLSLDGWSKQQILKFKAVLGAKSAATLVLDSDTVLLTEKTWFSKDEKQILQFSEEFHRPYRNLMKDWIGLVPSLPVSFVTHHQLMQKEIVAEIFSGDEAFLSWCRLAKTPGNKMSEYETYGHYVVENHPTRVEFASWSNLWSPGLQRFLEISRSGKEPRELVKGYNSISFHSHSQL